MKIFYNKLLYVFLVLCMQGVSLHTHDDDHLLDMNKLLCEANEYYNQLSDYEKCQYLVESPLCDVQVVIPLLSSIDIHQKNTYGETLLHSAIPYGRLEVIQLLVESGVDVDALDHNGYSPLYTTFIALIECIGMCYPDEMEDSIYDFYFDTYIETAEFLVHAGADITLLYNHDRDNVKMVANLSDIVQEYIDRCSLENEKRPLRSKVACQFLLKHLRQLQIILSVS